MVLIIIILSSVARAITNPINPMNNIAWIRILSSVIIKKYAASKIHFLYNA